MLRGCLRRRRRRRARLRGRMSGGGREVRVGLRLLQRSMHEGRRRLRRVRSGLRSGPLRLPPQRRLLQRRLHQRRRWLRRVRASVVVPRALDLRCPVRSCPATIRRYVAHFLKPVSAGAVGGLVNFANVHYRASRSQCLGTIPVAKCIRPGPPLVDAAFAARAMVLVNVTARFRRVHRVRTLRDPDVRVCAVNLIGEHSDDATRETGLVSSGSRAGRRGPARPEFAAEWPLAHRLPKSAFVW